ncbi:pentatricopeptide repeat-containing protein At1g69290 [Dioscorea cayenensis subsp. rotundata]|uniref:Pentatricopeptide repeat-containing protein At1g69290 n=1 Tax=Dioscorea cayennensis subsp. rotundata TaxID=55577 RepID=A0AB40CBR6_DIOCR|nr:pentatricopeptide repeat-containing protein At1g69290 [Dioscorea cayenensis subsp. rotundata]
MWRKLSLRSFSGEVPVLYSFLQPTIFAPAKPRPSPPLPPPQAPSPSPSPSPSPADISTLQSQLQLSLSSGDLDLAWRSFKSLAALSPALPSNLSNSLISCLSSPPLHLPHLKRALAATLHLLSHSPHSLSSHSLLSLFSSLSSAPSPAPALTLARSLLQNRFFAPFSIWGPFLLPIVKTPHWFPPFLKLFEESCKLALQERANEMKPDLASCNDVLDGCCRVTGSVSDAERVLEIISSLGLSLDERSFGLLAYLYASKGLETKIVELDCLMTALGFMNKKMSFFRSLISGYVKSGDFDSVSKVLLRALKEKNGGNDCVLDEDGYKEVVKGFVENERFKDLAALIIETQEVESHMEMVGIESSVGFGIVNACVVLGWLEKAHNLLDEMSAQGAAVGIGVYSSILKAYCKEQRTAEAAQLVTEISAAGLQLDVGSFDALIDSSMTAQDFQSAFSLFRDMREARLPELKMSYLTIMTGLMENHRPELMAAFLDSVIDDPRVEVATHDWNSIIHAFCKVGRLEDARRTYRRIVFLRFEPNQQTFLSLINGYVSTEKFFSVLLLWTDVRRKGMKLDHDLLDAFLYALVKGGFFDAAMQVVEKAQELKIFIDKWRHKQAFMEKHKKLKVAKLRKRNFRKMEALIAFKNWAGLNA